MTATYTFDIFTSLDGNASYGPPGDWGEQGPEFLDQRLAAFPQKRVSQVLRQLNGNMDNGPMVWPVVAAALR